MCATEQISRLLSSVTKENTIIRSYKNPLSRGEFQSPTLYFHLLGSCYQNRCYITYLRFFISHKHRHYNLKLRKNEFINLFINLVTLPNIYNNLKII